MKTKQEIEVEFNCNLQDLAYNSMVASIPMAWKTKIKSNTVEKFLPSKWDLIHVKLNMDKLKTKIYTIV